MAPGVRQGTARDRIAVSSRIPSERPGARRFPSTAWSKLTHLYHQSAGDPCRARRFGGSVQWSGPRRSGAERSRIGSALRQGLHSLM